MTNDFRPRTSDIFEAQEHVQDFQTSQQTWTPVGLLDLDEAL